MFTKKKFKKALEAQDIQTLALILTKTDKKDLFARDYGGYETYDSAITFTIRNNLMESFKFLLENGFPVSTEVRHRYPLRSALEYKRFEMFSMLLDYVQDLQKFNLPKDVLMEHDFSYFEAITKKGIDVDYRYFGGNTLLHMAAECKLTDHAKKLIALGANINALNQYNNTPLHFSIHVNCRAITQELLDLGALTNIPNSHGLTVAQLLGQEVNKEDVTTPENKWVLMNNESIAHIENFPDITRKMTEVFNFKSQERFIITQNTHTNAETSSPLVRFGDTNPQTIQEAFVAYKKAMQNKIPAHIKPPVYKSASPANPLTKKN